MKAKFVGAFSQLITLIGALLVSSNVIAEPAPASPTIEPPAGYKWEMVEALTDNFNGNTLDSNKWYDYHPVWSGRYPSRFKKGNAFVQDGVLFLRSTSQIDTPLADPESRVWVDAAAVVSKEKLAEPGWYYETSMKASDTAMSSSFWFRIGKYSEIDVIEHIGRATKGNVDATKSFLYEANTHVYGEQSGASIPESYKMATRGRDEFHRYGLWWKDANNLWFYHNGVKVFEIQPSVAFQEKLHMIFDTETLASQWVGYPTIESLKDDSRNAMKVDWVKTWKLVPGEPEPPVSAEHSIPGKIEAEQFSNQSGIQVEPTSDSGGGDNIGYIENGDVAEYKVNVAQAGKYKLSFRVASATNGGNLVIKTNSSTLASLSVPGTGAWQNWQTIEQEVTLAKGVQTLSLDFTGGSGYLFNLNWLSAELLESNTGTAYKTHVIPGLIQAEDYDNGGEGVGYSDSNTSNLGGQYRNDGVDIGDAADIGGGQFVGWVEAGEWLQYTISNITQGNYDVNLRLAGAGTSDKSVSLNIDGNALGNVNFKATDGWQNWQTQTLKNVYISGESNQQLRVHMEAGALNLNWIEFVPVSNVSVDQCNNTQQCRNEFGSQATDCLNSQSATSICMCGTSQCL